MDAALTIFYQIIKMFIIMGVGYLLYKKNVITDASTAVLSNLLLMVATPCTLITSFNQEFSALKLQNLGYTFILSVFTYLFFILLATLLYRGDMREEKFSLVFSNAGFIGIPLVTGLLGIESVFYLSVFIVCFYLFAWTYGIIVMSKDKSMASVGKLAKNPCVWAVVIGLIIFIMPVKPFAAVMEAVSMMGNLNTPLAMLVLGSYLGRCQLKEIFIDKRIYLISFYRLVLLPVLLIFIFKFLPAALDEIKMIIFIAASAPVGALLPMFAQIVNRDTNYGAEIVSLSTILSLITLPLVLMAAQMVW